MVHQVPVRGLVSFISITDERINTDGHGYIAWMYWIK